MITHEIQPNLGPFELRPITSGSLSAAPLPGSPPSPSSLRIWREAGAASLPGVAGFQVSLFERSTEPGPTDLDGATFPSTDRRA